VRAPGIALLALAGCASPITEVVLEVDSDFEPPSELTSIEIEVTSPDDETQMSMADLGGGEPELPRTLSMVHENGPLGPYVIEVVGFRRGMERVRRVAELTFIKDESRRLRIDLEAACETVSCDAGETCAAGECRDRAVTPDELQPL